MVPDLGGRGGVPADEQSERPLIRSVRAVGLGSVLGVGAAGRPAARRHNGGARWQKEARGVDRGGEVACATA